uniref:Pseudouridine synthase n=1 Tax=Parascaris univalens TaxID=6257 RepID=A0A914ZR32_PARUN
MNKVIDNNKREKYNVDYIVESIAEDILNKKRRKLNEEIDKKRINKRSPDTDTYRKVLVDDTYNDMPSNIPFHIKNGIRYLNAYWSTYCTKAKGRWIGRKLVDVFQEEFLSQHRNYAMVACKLGRLFVNERQMTDVDYVLKNNDTIVHVIHRHEHPILAKPIEFIENNDDLLVVNKPPSMPVHACGQYRLHTVMGLLHSEHNINDLRVLHRLDRTTSGILIFAKNYETDLEFKEALKCGELYKEYICKVEGIFPGSGEEVICEEPIGALVLTMGIQCVRSDGKSARTRFRCLWSDGKTSIVKCVLDTGRTHQIRVHLQYLGFPIVDDELYNTDVWGPQKGKNAEYGKSYEELCKDITTAHRSSLWHETIDPDYEERMQKFADGEVQAEPEDLRAEDRPDYDPICLGCNVTKRNASASHFMLHLHCLKYETSKWSFSTRLPEWAIEPKTNSSRI